MAQANQVTSPRINPRGFDHPLFYLIIPNLETLIRMTFGSFTAFPLRCLATSPGPYPVSIGQGVYFLCHSGLRTYDRSRC